MRTEVLFLILGMALVTYITRYAPLGLLRTTGIPGWLERWLKHIPTAILTALIIPALLLPQGQLDISLHNPYLIAGVVSAITALYSRNIIATLIMGMGAMLLLKMVIL